MKRMKLSKKIVTLGLATVMTFSFSMMAFAYQSDYGEKPLGDSYMSGHLDIDGTYAHASMDAGVTSDLYIEGRAHYWNVYGDEHETGILSGASQTTSCGTTLHRNMCEFISAWADFSACSNDGGDNSLRLELY